MCLADPVLLHDDEGLARGQVECRPSSAMTAAARATVSIVRCPLASHITASSVRFLVGGREVAAFLLQLLEKRVVDGRLDQQVAVAGTARAVILRLADARVHGRLGEVGGLVDDDGGVAGADAVGRLARAVRRLHHRGTAGGNRQIADRHQLLRQRNARLLEAQDQIFGRALLAQRRADARARSRARSSGSCGCGEKMTASRHLIALIAMLTIVTSGLVTGSRPAITPAGLAYFDDALFGKLLDDADALRPQRVAQDAENLPAPRRHAVGAAHAAFVDAHAGEPAERLFVGGRPRDRAAQTIDGRLIVVSDGRHGGAGAREQRLRGGGFFDRKGSGRLHAHHLKRTCCVLTCVTVTERVS